MKRCAIVITLVGHQNSVLSEEEIPTSFETSHDAGNNINELPVKGIVVENQEWR